MRGHAFLLIAVDCEESLKTGWITRNPITYEDFANAIGVKQLNGGCVEIPNLLSGFASTWSLRYFIDPKDPAYPSLRPFTICPVAEKRPGLKLANTLIGAAIMELQKVELQDVNKNLEPNMAFISGMADAMHGPQNFLDIQVDLRFPDSVLVPQYKACLRNARASREKGSADREKSGLPVKPNRKKAHRFKEADVLKVWQACQEGKSLTTITSELGLADERVATRYKDYAEKIIGHFYTGDMKFLRK